MRAHERDADPCNIAMGRWEGRWEAAGPSVAARSKKRSNTRHTLLEAIFIGCG